MENSIEEDIARVKQRIEDVKEYIEYGLPYSEYLDLENSFDNILSDYKRVLKENKELKSRIPSLENGTYTGDIEGFLKLEKEIVKRDNEIKQLKEEVSQYKKIKEISENITLEDVKKAAKDCEKDYVLREKVKEIAHELYYNNYKGNLDDGKFAQEMAEELEKALREEQEKTMKEGEE